MYVGSNRTALASQRQIAQAMMQLIQEKPYAQISVSELCRAAGISRQTFYTLFTNRDNVMVFTLQARYCCSEDIPQAAESGACNTDVIRGLCQGYSQYLYRNRDLIKTLVDNHIDYLLYDSFFDAMNRCECAFGEVEPCMRKYATGFYAGGVSSVAKQYAQEGCSASPDQLESLLFRLFTGEIFS